MAWRDGLHYDNEAHSIEELKSASWIWTPTLNVYSECQSAPVPIAISLGDYSGHSLSLVCDERGEHAPSKAASPL